MKSFQHDYEPIVGLPAPLPAGETILWQGAPDWKTFARRAMRIRVLSVYFVLLIVWSVSGGLSAAAPWMDIAFSAIRLVGLGIVAIGVLTLFAWLVGRTTVYTITTRRVVIRYGIALATTLQIPYAKIETASVHVWSNGAGDVALTMLPSERVGYLIMWPHARPWKLARTQPSLRCIPDAAAVAQILGRALAASAEQPATAVPVSGNTSADNSGHATATA